MRYAHPMLRAVFAGSLLAASAAPAQAPDAPACMPRVAEKLGIRFVEVCASDTTRFGDAEAHGAEALPAFWIAATPLPCSEGGHETVACDPLTALEVSAVEGAGKNRPLGALLVDAELAHRICMLRFGGRLPTPLEREQARRELGLVSLRVREEPGTSAKLRIDDQPEWVAEGDCLSSPSKPGPGCRITPFPPVEARPRAKADVLLACVAEPADPRAHAAPIGSACFERPVEGDIRSPDCAIAVTDREARFELGCQPATDAGAQRPEPSQAAVRCVLSNHDFGRSPTPATPRPAP